MTSRLGTPITLAILAALVAAPAIGQTPLGTEFTYQGVVKQSGAPLNATADFQFKLFGVVSGGTQIGGTQSVNNVTVSDGQFTVQLNDAGQFGATAFNGDKRWLEIAVRSPAGGGAFTTLTPRQPLTAAPYAMFALSGPGGSGPWTVSGTNIFNSNSGNVGVGTTTPQTKLHVNGQSAWLTGGNGGGLPAAAGAGLRMYFDGTRGNIFSFDYATATPRDIALQEPGGRVGIGTTTPQAPLELRAPNVGALPGEGIRVQGTLTTVANQAYVSFHNGSGTAIGYVGDGSTGDNTIFLGAYVGDVCLNPATRALTAKPDGKVGIGTTTPTQKLEVVGGAIQVINQGDQADALWFGIERSWVFRQQDSGAVTALKLQSVGGGGNKNFLIQTDGFVGIGTLSPQAKLDVNGTVRAQVVEITGADLAERFPSSDEKVEPGTVMEIDPQNPGKLRVARGAYNRRVAGVVSGANDFAAGAILGNLPGHEDAPPIALSGRVYVRCDASARPIEPGDLLTTSDTPGHAMRVTDFAKAQGAIIGKAMSTLKHGDRGLVLVLVSLQ